jgi:hypothetical protein
MTLTYGIAKIREGLASRAEKFPEQASAFVAMARLIEFLIDNGIVFSVSEDEHEGCFKYQIRAPSARTGRDYSIMLGGWDGNNRFPNALRVNFWSHGADEGLLEIAGLEIGHVVQGPSFQGGDPEPWSWSSIAKLLITEGCRK